MYPKLLYGYLSFLFLKISISLHVGLPWSQMNLFRDDLDISLTLYLFLLYNFNISLTRLFFHLVKWEMQKVNNTFACYNFCFHIPIFYRYQWTFARILAFQHIPHPLKCSEPALTGGWT